MSVGMDIRERLEILEASHVKLMTDHEMEVRRNDKAWRRHRKWLAGYQAQVAINEARYAKLREEERERGKELDERIRGLVMAVGELIRRERA